MRDLFDILALVLPIGGIEYKIPPVSAEHGVLMDLAREGDEEAQAKLDMITGPQMFLGPIEQLMIDNGHQAHIARATLTAIADHRWGRETADRTWESGELPELQAAIIAAAAEAARENSSSKTSTSTASARKTPLPASTGRTTSRKATPPSKRPAKKSAGRK